MASATGVCRLVECQLAGPLGACRRDINISYHGVDDSLGHSEFHGARVNHGIRVT